MTTTEIKIGYELIFKDLETYVIKAKFFDSNDNYLKETEKSVSCKEFNDKIVYTEEELEIKNKAETVVKAAMYKSISSLLEKEILTIVDEMKKTD
jgi:hypothetical protein